ncbi:MAG: hypothetical protein JNL05_11610 [Flavobacteriales bacterium]|nr:hypothetical protein [Flavobacteriales bacterium]
MAAERKILLAASVLLACLANAQPILDRLVDVQATRVPLAQALDLVARDGRFKLSYNAASWPVDSVVDVQVNGTVRQAMHGLIGRDAVLKESGEHLILLGEGGARNRRSVHGRVVDDRSGAPVARAAVVEVGTRNAIATDGQGRFVLNISGTRERTPLLFSRNGFSDTVVFVPAVADLGTVVLRAHERLETLEPRCNFERCAVEDLGVTRLLVPTGQQALADEVEDVQDVQFSVWPNIGTNKEMSGATVNRFSFNLLAGYARGLEGFELGIGVNMERRDVKGVQFAGLANLVGRHTSGVQLAGGLNHTMRSFEGLQLAGFGNTVWDTLSGAQIAGGANVVKGGMQGTQVAGGCNVATHDCDGVQVAGGVNVTVRDVRKAQVAGGVNYARAVSGAQVAAGINVATAAVGGGQVGFAGNYARSVTGGQFTFGINVVADTVRGGQVGVLNFGRVSDGGQVGILNLSDTITGTSVGILSIARRGYHRFSIASNDVMALSLIVRTGTRGFHNILGWSPPVTADERWGFLYGFGTELAIGGRGSLVLDLTGEQVVEQREWVDAVNIVGRLGLCGGLRVAGPMDLQVGPMLNVLVSDWRDADQGTYLSALPPSDPLFSDVSGTARITGWLGWRAALSLRF